MTIPAIAIPPFEWTQFQRSRLQEICLIPASRIGVSGQIRFLYFAGNQSTCTMKASLERGHGHAEGCRRIFSSPSFDVAELKDGTIHRWKLCQRGSENSGAFVFGARFFGVGFRIVCIL